MGEEVTQFLAELIDLGLDYRLRQLYRQFEDGQISLGYFANELGLGLRDLHAAARKSRVGDLEHWCPAIESYSRSHFRVC